MGWGWGHFRSAKWLPVGPFHNVIPKRVQGYLFSAPVPAGQVLRVVEDIETTGPLAPEPASPRSDGHGDERSADSGTGRDAPAHSHASRDANRFDGPA